MSWVALAWASQQKLERASDKLILLAFADRHNDETGFAYPSIKWLEEFSSLNRKTVIQCIDRLETAGILIDSGRRVGATRQVKVYCLQVGEITVPKRGPLNSTDFSGKESQKRYSEPSREPTSPIGERNARASKRCPDEWKPSEADYDAATNAGLTTAEIIFETSQFRDYEYATPHKDWSAAFRFWMRKASQKRTRNDHQRPSPKSEHLERVARAMAASVGGSEGERPDDCQQPDVAGGSVPRLTVVGGSG